MKFLSLLLLALLETTSAGVTGSCTDLLSFHGTNIKIMGPLVGPGKCLIPEQAIGNGNDDIPVWGHMDMFIPMALSPTLQRRGSSGYSGGGGGVRGGSISGTGSTDDLGSGGGGGGGVSGTGSKDNLGSGGSGSGAVEMVSRSKYRSKYRYYKCSW